MGRGRGGFSTKVHLACDGKGRPLSVIVTPGQRNDGTQLFAVLDAIRVPRMGRGRPRKRPEVERCVGRLKQWRAIATRYDKRAINYRAMVGIASLMIWLAS